MRPARIRCGVGSTRDHVESIETVLAGGTLVEFGNEPLARSGAPPVAGRAAARSRDERQRPTPRAKRRLSSGWPSCWRENSQIIRQKQPPLIRNSAGYYVRGLLSATHLDVPRLLVGSEGTLGLFTAATLETFPLPPHRAAVLLLFGDLESATQRRAGNCRPGAERVRPDGPAAVVVGARGRSAV